MTFDIDKINTTHELIRKFDTRRHFHFAFIMTRRFTNLRSSKACCEEMRKRQTIREADRCGLPRKASISVYESSHCKHSRSAIKNSFKLRAKQEEDDLKVLQ